MLTILNLLAVDADLTRGLVPGKSTGMVLADVFKVVGTLLALTLFLFLIIYISRASRRSHRTRHHRHHHRQASPSSESGPAVDAPIETDPPATPLDAQPEEDSVPRHHRRRRRREQRREHRGRKPTLAETGGLPPVRDPNTPPPPLI